MADYLRPPWASDRWKRFERKEICIWIDEKCRSWSRETWDWWFWSWNRRGRTWSCGERRGLKIEGKRLQRTEEQKPFENPNPISEREREMRVVLSSRTSGVGLWTCDTITFEMSKNFGGFIEDPTLEKCLNWDRLVDRGSTWIVALAYLLIRGGTCVLLSRLDLSVLTIVTGYITCKFLINFLIKEGINKIQGHFIKNKNLRVCFIKKKKITKCTSKRNPTKIYVGAHPQ